MGLEPKMVEYIPWRSPTLFVVRLDGEEHFLTVLEFKALYAEMEEAAQAYEAGKAAIRLDLKSRYEAARKRR